jgi:adenosylmethionine-8-amino-7-oxononanoate aminotransferase
MCLAKAITNGYFPFGATMISEAMAEVFEKAGPDGFIGHGYTYSAHPVGSAAAIACITEVKKQKVNENAAARGKQLYDGLVKLQTKHTALGDVRGGHGLMCGIEFVSDRATRKPADPAFGLTVQKVAYENGVMLRASGPNIILSPPLVIGAKDIDTILRAIDKGIAAAS